MSETFLGIIAVSALVMAIVQVGVLIGAFVMIKRLSDVVTRIEFATKPVLARIESLAMDTADSIAVVRAQIDRVEDTALGVLERADQAIQRVEHYLLAPARQTMALAAGARAVFGALGGPLARVFRSGAG
jgi:hypothetical protein